MSAAAASTLVESFVERLSKHHGLTESQRKEVYKILFEAARDADWSEDTYDLKGKDEALDDLLKEREG
jgi:hypothetical protein